MSIKLPPLCARFETRGLLDDTLVIWGGEFGPHTLRSRRSQPRKIRTRSSGKAFSIWMAGGGIKGGVTYGRTDDFGFNVVEQPVQFTICRHHSALPRHR